MLAILLIRMLHGVHMEHLKSGEILCLSQKDAKQYGDAAKLHGSIIVLVVLQQLIVNEKEEYKRAL